MVYDILLVEDNPDHVLLVQEAFEEAQSSNNLHVVEDGLEALKFLNQEPPYEGAKCPDLILLDLNLPRKDGRELLRDLKQDGHLSHVPVIVFTSSSSQQYIDMCYALHANCYVTKPVGFDQYVDILKMIEEFWFSTIKLPSHC
jgi:CheY-like chemotaxis protein